MTSIALIGPGRHGTAIAKLFASHGIDVTLYHHRPEKARSAAAAVSAVAKNATVNVADSVNDAVNGQEIVFLATLWDRAQRDVINTLGDALQGKILVDVSNPLDVTPVGIIPRTPAEGSAGQFVATLLPANVGHVKVFSNLATDLINAGADVSPLAVLPFAADSQRTADRIRPYLEATGWQPWLVGDISVSGDLEIGGKFNNVQGRHGRSRLDAVQMLEYAGPEAKL